MSDFSEFIIFMVVSIAIILGSIAGFADVYGRYQCGNYAELTGMETRWVFLDSCYINDSEMGWVTYGERKAAVVAERGLKGDSQ